MTITDVYNYIISQKESEASFRPIVEIGQIDVPYNFVDDVIKCKLFEKKSSFGQPGTYWDGANNWHNFVTKPRHHDITDSEFVDINNQIIEKARKMMPDFSIISSCIFLLSPGGYIIPHIDRPGNPNELYMPFNWPVGMHMAWKDYGEIHPVCNTLYAFDTSKEHAIVNMSNEDRYVYIICPTDNNSIKPVFTSNNISS